MSISQIPTQQDQVLAALSKFVRDMPTIIEYNVALAQVRRAAYLAYMQNGFTEQQALELCAK